GWSSSPTRNYEFFPGIPCASDYSRVALLVVIITRSFQRILVSCCECRRRDAGRTGRRATMLIDTAKKLAVADEGALSLGGARGACGGPVGTRDLGAATPFAGGVLLA